MKRREFITTGLKAAATGVAIPVSNVASSLTATARAQVATAETTPPAILASYTEEDHRRRLTNIGLCTQGIRKCMRKHLITNYLPAQCVYNMGEYPSREPWEPGESDEQELDRLKEHGIQLIHVMDEWNDRYGLFGGNKLTAVNPEGFRRFVSMVQKRGIKILAYASSGYFNGTDPDFRWEWSRSNPSVNRGWWDLVRCEPGSPGWRAFLLPRMIQILEDYEVDGLYNDWGYRPNESPLEGPRRKIPEPARDEVVGAFEETPEYDGAKTDLLHLIYSEVKRRGGIYKMHADITNQPQTRGLKVYDYLWVGEGVDNADTVREVTKNHNPYLVPCIDQYRAQVEHTDEHFLQSIPYMQFPLLQGGIPFTGERSVIPIPRLPGVKESGRYAAAWEYFQANPDGPHIYGGWDPIPPNPEMRPAHAHWLKRYLPLVEDGTWAFLEIADSNLFVAPLPKDCVASAFANRELFLVLANFGQNTVEIETSENYLQTDQSSGAPRKRWRLPRRSLQILRRSV